MKTSSRNGILTVLLLLLGVLAVAQIPEATTADHQDPGAKQMHDLNLSVFDPTRYGFLPPVSYRNLSVFLITGEDSLGQTPMLTLQEALEQKKALVKETGQVGNLLITNKSDGQYIFIQAGDIVRGGKQDRTLQHDLIIPPLAKDMPLHSFCVEQGRWRQRADEPLAEFGSADNALASNRLKIAAKVYGSQSMVWENVDVFQRSLTARLDKPVRSSLSQSSLELTLEDDDLKQALQPYLDILKPLGSLRQDLVGVAFALNGQITSVDIYASQGIFLKLWPKLLKAAASEALTKTEKDAKYTIPTSQALQYLLVGLEKTKAQPQHLNDITTQVVRRGADYALFETHFCPQNVILHLNWLYLEKGASPDAQDLLIEPREFRQ